MSEGNVMEPVGLWIKVRTKHFIDATPDKKGMTWNYPKATRYLESERGENKLKDTIFHLVNAASHMWAHTDIKYELLTFMPYVHKAVSLQFI